MERLELVARAHDALAPTYDSAMAANPVAEWMRRELWAHYARVFPSNGRLLDLAAGTGTDALHLAQGGASVVAIDVSAGMLAQLQARAASRGLRVDARVVSLEDLDQLGPGYFDGALCAFAGLNTVDGLARFSTHLARVLKPRSHVVIHALNGFCLWESANRLLHLQRPRRRQETTQIGGHLVTHRFYDPLRLYKEVFVARFELRELYALSVIAAPGWLARAPRLAPLVLRIDRAVGRALPRAGDFFVMDLVAQ